MFPNLEINHSSHNENHDTDYDHQQCNALDCGSHIYSHRESERLLVDTHTLSWQASPSLQSANVKQCFPFSHLAEQDPPQSTSLSISVLDPS